MFSCKCFFLGIATYIIFTTQLQDHYPPASSLPNIPITPLHHPYTVPYPSSSSIAIKGLISFPSALCILNLTSSYSYFSLKAGCCLDIRSPNETGSQAALWSSASEYAIVSSHAASNAPGLWEFWWRRLKQGYMRARIVRKAIRDRSMRRSSGTMICVVSWLNIVGVGFWRLGRWGWCDAGLSLFPSQGDSLIIGSFVWHNAITTLIVGWVHSRIVQISTMGFLNALCVLRTMLRRAFPA